MMLHFIESELDIILRADDERGRIPARLERSVGVRHREDRSPVLHRSQGGLRWKLYMAIEGIMALMGDISTVC